MTSLPRRTILKSIAYGSALSVGGLSAVAFANSDISETNNTIEKEALQTITLFNQSDKTIVLDASQPVSIEQVNSWVVVKINKASENQNVQQTLSLASGQRLPFTIDSELAPLLKSTGDYIVITNEFTALNNMIPITTHDALVA